MKTRILARANAAPADERGFALVSVVLMGVVLMAVAVITMTQVQTATHQSTGHLSFEREIHLAETGVEQALARLQQNDQWSIPTSTPFPGTSSAAAEKAWVLAELESAALETSDGGQYAILKPAGSNVVYAAGWAPKKASAARMRVVKAEYLFSTYSPGNAVLTNGPLDIGGNASVQGDLGNVHANGDITVVGNSLTVTGSLSATGSITGGQSGWLGSQPPQQVPAINPRAIYDKFATDESYKVDWYDLCPDGTMRRPAVTPSAPCTGAETYTGETVKRGWEFKNGKWDNDRDPKDGIYYIYQGTAKIRGTSTLWRATILAESSGTAGSLVKGDIEMTGNPQLTGFLPDTALVAGRDLDIQGTGSGDGSYEGLLGAHEQFKVTGNPTLYGALVSEDSPHTSGSPVSRNYVSGSMIIEHDKGMETELGGLVRTTLWLEL